LPAAKTLEVSRLLTGACAEMIEGQALDLNYEQRATVSVDDYLLMIGKKTGALLECSLHVGAVIGTEDRRAIEGMRLFGKGIGMLFQVRDDMLGVWGLQEATGKPAASDLRRRKKSLPVVHALQEARHNQAAQRFPVIYGSKDPLADEQVGELLEVLDRVGSKRFCHGLAETHALDSLHQLEGLEIPRGARKECEELVTFLMERDY